MDCPKGFWLFETTFKSFNDMDLDMNTETKANGGGKIRRIGTV